MNSGSSELGAFKRAAGGRRDDMAARRRQFTNQLVTMSYGFMGRLHYNTTSYFT